MDSLLQKFGRPSRRYTAPPAKKDYHLIRHDLVRAAQITIPNKSAPSPEWVVVSEPTTPVTESHTDARTARKPRAKLPSSIRSAGTSSGDDSSSTITPTNAQHPRSVVRHDGSSEAATTTRVSRITSIRTVHLPPPSHQPEPDSDDDFYTPLSSPVPSNRSSHSSLVQLADNPPTASSSSTSIASDVSESSVASSSSIPHSVSTNITTPPSSESGKEPPLRQTGGSRSSHSSTSSSRRNSSEEDWAKDVLWLTPASSRPKMPTWSSDVSSHSSGSHPNPAPRRPTVQARHSAPPRARSERVRVRRRMSVLIEDSAEEDDNRTTSPAPDSSTPVRRRSSRRHPRGASAVASSSASSVTAELPMPLPPTSEYAPAAGYTSLVLPRASYTPESGARVSARIARGTVDLTLGGRAQTTMATVEVVRGIAAASGGGSRILGAFGRRSSSESDVRSAGSPLAFTSHVAPPTFVPDTCVLVQVCAVALDGIDELLVSTAAGGKGKGKARVGFVPGRSFVGRALEVGSSVREDWIKRGEWLVGLLDVAKSGALAEFVVIDRRRLRGVARPIPPTSPISRRGSQIMPSGLTLEELALLPLCGVPAYRAISTFSDEKHTDARALILQAHDGAGAFALQMLKRRGVRVTAHIPPNAPKAAEALVRSLGAEDVRRDEPLHVLDELRAAKARFDFILDTVGGPAIWTAGRALLAAGAQGDDRPEPQFTTLVGDAPDVPVPGARAHWRAGMRALGIRGGEGSVGYAWVSVGADVDLAGEDVRDALGALVEDAEKPTGARPRVDRSSRVLPFERAPELFADGARTLCFGGTAVVKIAD